MTSKEVGIQEEENSAEFTHREVGGVREILSFPKGLRANEVEYQLYPFDYLTGDPSVNHRTPDAMTMDLTRAWQRTQEAREPFGDTNGLKVSVKGLGFSPVGRTGLIVVGGLTDYFTLWGLPQVAPLLQERFLNEMARFQGTKVPNGLSAHTIILTSDNRVVMMVRSQSQGFHTGRVSLSIEEQTDPDKDATPFNTPYRGIWEELGIISSPQDLRLLGVGAERALAYTCFCFVSHVDADEETLRQAWKGAQDHNEASALFLVPLEELDRWTGTEISPEVWLPYSKDSAIASDAILQPHPTVLWRADLLKKHLAAR